MRAFGAPVNWGQARCCAYGALLNGVGKLGGAVIFAITSSRASVRQRDISMGTSAAASMLSSGASISTARSLSGIYHTAMRRASGKAVLGLRGHSCRRIEQRSPNLISSAVQPWRPRSFQHAQTSKRVRTSNDQAALCNGLPRPHGHRSVCPTRMDSIGVLQPAECLSACWHCGLSPAPARSREIQGSRKAVSCAADRIKAPL
jgi:hypothetical protein